ncbi:MAG: polyprenol monophosphomannose synthase [Candidatus Peribacteraceae bacterium]|nr:polyprenol monophosphomannose synthase [Candidatus Peribacteraceae bacterium]
MLSLILPTYNEAENIRAVIAEARRVLEDVPHEIIVVDDDSPDGTWRIVHELSEEDPHVRAIRRVGRRGLSSAVVEGFRAAKGDVLAVADADGQHDYALLPRLYAAVREKGGIAIGSRYVEGGSVGAWDERRRLLSRLATQLAIRLCRVPVSDPMSGFFAVSRPVFERVLPHLRPKGFKILFEILLHAERDMPVTEMPFTFGIRKYGRSKLSLGVEWAFLAMLLTAVLRRAAGIFRRS